MIASSSSVWDIHVAGSAKGSDDPGGRRMEWFGSCRHVVVVVGGGGVCCVVTDVFSRHGGFGFVQDFWIFIYNLRRRSKEIW